MTFWRCDEACLELVGGSGIIYEPTTHLKFMVKNSASPSSIASFLEQSLTESRLPIRSSHCSAKAGISSPTSERVAWRIVEAACGCLACTSIALPYLKTPTISTGTLKRAACSTMGSKWQTWTDSARCAHHAKDAIHRFGRQKRGKRILPMSGTKVGGVAF
jgi:hypothetical protein